MAVKKLHSYLVEDRVTVNIYVIEENGHFTGKIVETSMHGYGHDYQFFKQYNSQVCFGRYECHCLQPLTREDMILEFSEQLAPYN